jgi:ankyrin repeat protein
LPIVCCLVVVIWLGQSRDSSTAIQAAAFEAARDGNTVELRKALALGASVDAKETRTEMTLLALASRFGSEEDVRLLLDAGGDVHANCRGFGPPLSNAAAVGAVSTVRLLLARGANPNLGDPSGYTPLMQASMMGHQPVIDALLAAGADVNARDQFGTTAFLAASSQDDRRVVRRLVEAGADVDQ